MKRTDLIRTLGEAGRLLMRYTTEIMIGIGI